MNRALFERFRRIVREAAGIELRDGKEALVEARVAKRLRALGIADARRYLDYLESAHRSDELVHFLNVITTNHTSFLREPEHFQRLADLVRSWGRPASGMMRFWSVAASTGEEAYSIALTVDEPLDGTGVDYKILATDLSTTCLEAGVRGEYASSRLDPLTRYQRCRYFRRVSRRDDDENVFAVRPEVKHRVLFRRLNLSEPPFPMRGPFDAIFCRNVMIYLDRATRRSLLLEIDRLLKPGGVLFIGHSETLSGMNTGLVVVEPSVYSKPGPGPSKVRR